MLSSGLEGKGKSYSEVKRRKGMFDGVEMMVDGAFPGKGSGVVRFTAIQNPGAPAERSFAD